MIVKKKSKKQQKSKFNKFNISSFYHKFKFDLLAILLLSLFFIGLNLSLTSNMNQLPSPIFGGDLYYQMGCVNHIKYGGNMFDNCNLLSENPGYFPLYSIIVGTFANLFNIDSLNAELLFSSIFLFFSVIITYILFKSFSNNILISIFGVLLFLTPIKPILKYTEFSTFLITPMIILSFYLFYLYKNYPSSIFLGISLGLGTISHSTLFIAGYFAFFCFSYFILNNETYFKINLNYIKKNFIFYFKRFSLIFIIMLIISLFYWLNPIMHGGQTAPHYLEWNGPGDMSQISLQFDIFFKIIKNTFFNFSTITNIISSLLMFFGVFLLLFLKKNKKDSIFKKMNFSSLMVYILFSITFSYILTIPILGIHFVPNYMIYVFGKIIISLFLILSLLFFIKFCQDKFNIKKIYISLFLLLLIFIFSFQYISYVNTYKNNQWYKSSFSPLDNSKQDLSNYLIKNTDVNDVILTTKELGFMINSISGRKLVTGRWAQNDAFENLASRDLDSSIMLYGNDSTIIKNLLNKYKVKYLYWDYYWIQSEYSFDNSGKMIGWFDPMIAFYNESNINLLKENNVKYFIENTYVDPALKSKYHPKFDLIFVSPQNYNNISMPWNSILNQYFEEVWSYNYQGKKIAKLYKIDLSK